MVIEEAYRSRRLATFAGEPVELVSIQVVGQGLRDGESVSERVRPSRPEPAPPPPRKAYFGAETGWLETPVLRRSDLSTPRTGLVIIEEYDATCVIPPGAMANHDDGGNILIELR